MRRDVPRLLLVLIFLFYAVGCEQRSDANLNLKQDSHVSATNADMLACADVSLEVANLTPEQRKVKEMRGCLDEGDCDRAIVLARDLMDSKDVSVRENVVLVLGWMGRRALPELTEMLRDRDSGIANDALVAWENACEEYSSEKVRANFIVKSVKGIEDPSVVDSMLMHLTFVDENVALDTLFRIIVENKGCVPAMRARDMYEHIKGEIYD